MKKVLFLIGCVLSVLAIITDNVYIAGSEGIAAAVTITWALSGVFKNIAKKEVMTEFKDIA